ncbi:hypothetical protein MKJ01_06285 [Chryseobacterium sp. SSA4.19]|uniref:hypothetical protein n=1 Tax=Chryseobacterium sp. SSA4.19 TaxID=2919915 RepID=UPI001F4EAF95|nr:hypothetical protein [Chryseobacterium sp. SSA4.19]MCJ8153369.1 hypothetical protein [Chryseobacterium sp. SSA4.19]
MKEFTIVRGLFDSRKRSLIIDENFIKFENKDQTDDLFTVINKEDIAGIRYGINFIKGYSFYIGREYQIFIRTQSNKELKIFFKLFYGRKLNEKHQLYCDIIDQLWKNFIDRISNDYLQKIKNNEEASIAGVHFFNNRIRFNQQEILLEDIDVKKYRHHFIILSRQDHYKNKMLYYLKDKDAVILLDVINNLIKNEQLRTQEISDR